MGERRQTAGLFAHNPKMHCGDRLAAGGSRVRTAGPTFKEDSRYPSSNRQVLTLEVAGPAQFLAERGQKRRCPICFRNRVSPDRGGKIVRIQAKRRYGCRIELPRRL